MLKNTDQVDCNVALQSEKLSTFHLTWLGFKGMTTMTIMMMMMVKSEVNEHKVSWESL